MKILLIRHGQTDWNVAGKIQGSSDTDLNEEGIKQAEELSQKVIESGYHISKIYSSPLKRAVKTAEILSNKIHTDFLTMKDLEEINLGEWEGLTWRDVREEYPTEYDEWYHNRRYARPPKGESYQDMVERVLAAIREIIKDNDPATDVAIISHSAVIMCLQCCLTNTTFSEMKKFKAENSSITEMDSDLLMQL